MPLRITHAHDPITVDRILMTLYAVPGVGKSSLAFTAEAPLLLDFDAGVHRVLVRKDAVRVETWEDVMNITKEDLAPYKTLVVDTGGRALDALTLKIIADDPKMGRGGGALTLPGYGELKTRFTKWSSMIRALGLDVILIAHSDEQRKSDELIERIDMTGASKNEIYKMSDVMGRLSIEGGRRMLNFSPTQTAFGKNPANLPPLEIPDGRKDPAAFNGFLAKVIADTKAALNRHTAEQQECAALLAAWAAKVGEAKEAKRFDELASESGAIDDRIKANVKRLIVEAAKRAGFEYNKNAKAFQANGHAPQPSQATKVAKQEPLEGHEHVSHPVSDAAIERAKAEAAS